MKIFPPFLLFLALSQSNPKITILFLISSFITISLPFFSPFLLLCICYRKIFLQKWMGSLQRLMKKSKFLKCS